ncbi:MAG TPA: GMC family oxidoreductase [Solirubrobacterales bacterium]|nr:GMC family oxidoreductase [Solirubrobacterales bacterium]
MEEIFDVVIVGAGITGAIIAAEAADADLSVLVLEAGTDQARTFAGYREQLRTFYGAPFKTPEAPYAYNPNAPEPDIPGLPTPGADYFVEKGIPFGSTYARAAGGTTLHWLGTCLRMLPEDFDTRSRFERGLDWPLGYDDLEPDYRRAELEIGVSADVADQKHLGVEFPPGYDYPMERIPPSYLDEWLGTSLNGMTVELGGESLELLVRNTPVGRNSTPRAGYKPVGAVDHGEGFAPPTVGQALARDLGERCQGNSACVPICPVQAKYNAMKTLTRAADRGGVTIVTQAVASRVLTSGRKVTGIEYLRYESPGSPQAEKHLARGRAYVLACHAVENVKLMLVSGLQAKNGLVGAYLQDHPVLLRWGLAPKQVGAYRGPLSTAGIEDMRGGRFRARHAPFRVELGNDGWLWPTGAPDSNVAEAVAEGQFGSALRATMRDQLGRQLRMGFLIEQPPDVQNRIGLASRRDALGLPRPALTYNLDAYVLDGMTAATGVAKKLFARAGIEDHTDPVKGLGFKQQWGGQTFVWAGAGHFAGGHCMGASAGDSIVDSEQRSWDHDNLFVAGPGSMPTMGTANPTLTVAALAFRTARNLIAEPERAR